MKYTTEFPIRFGDIDYARVVYYPRFFHLYHRAFEDWFGDALGVPYSDVIIKHNIGFPAVKADSQFKKPLSLGDRARIVLELVDIGRKSITVHYEMYREPDGVLAAEATITTVAVDNDSFSSITIPAEFRKKFEAFKAAE